MNTSQYNYDDIIPSPIPATPDTLTQILYSDQYKLVLSYIRPLLLANELSLRALHLTTKTIELVPAHYTIWYYRYNIVAHLQSSKDGLPGNGLIDELDWCESMGISTLKSYQIWNYRKLIIQLIQTDKDYDFNKEFEIVARVLDEDEKNYHVWSYRKWLVETFNLYNSESELKYTADLLNKDVRNNSAWNHRFVVSLGESLSQDVFQRELDYVKKMIGVAPTNPSSWNYLKGLYKKLGKSLVDLKPFVVKYTESDNLSVYAYEILADIHVEEKNLVKSAEIYDLLGGKLDSIRVNYWKYKKSQITLGV
ncbi:hypothetical protein CANARDRAFT_235937 [[Candida] arabinofermentans NRRL YB-2248]|uniref:Protein farnesyltransferase/geranylgeranyltransferase type-1 subunit alpha n=1 Tax=[Candida] arabinofermentans NRRL YB-2248 TaxID=983967 RepID=A0A1E4SYS2_9ASCO|nr:hypothetical protein CANARDRAFT_235937 [[Candida] arabinofermentans NRRL YB-2248]